MRKFTFTLLAALAVWFSMAASSNADSVRFHVTVHRGYYGPSLYYYDYYDGPYYSYNSPSWYYYHGPRYYYGHRRYYHHYWHR
jgi:hypothetical protein